MTTINAAASPSKAKSWAGTKKQNTIYVCQIGDFSKAQRTTFWSGPETILSVFFDVPVKVHLIGCALCWHLYCRAVDPSTDSCTLDTPVAARPLSVVPTRGHNAHTEILSALWNGGPIAIVSVSVEYISGVLKAAVAEGEAEGSQFAWGGPGSD